MSGDKYLIKDQNACYFLTFTVIHWIDIFSRKSYRDIFINSLKYCIDHKGLILNAWVIMTNHIHLVGEIKKPHTMSEFIRDIKKFTSREIIKEIQEGRESRKDWLLDKFSFEAKRTGRAKNYKIWKDSNHAIDITDNDINVMERINYIHENPVKAGWVELPEHYFYSSAKNYCGLRGLFNVVLI